MGMMHRFLVLILHVWICTNSFAQEEVRGVVNDFYEVLDIRQDDCRVKVTLDRQVSETVGQKMVLIQMKGAVVDTSNTASFGHIVDLGNAGNFEIVMIDSVDSHCYWISGLLRSYDVTGKVQSVSMPSYQSVVLVDTIIQNPWDGTVGGVFALEVAETLFIETPIDVSGMGFRGGSISNNPNGGCGLGSPDYYYPLDLPGNAWPEGGAEKGEGIAEVSVDRRAGRGSLANGGGGGNKHNYGGAGGGNLTQGGKGGNPLVTCTDLNVHALGGNEIIVSKDYPRLFLGGGGGSGDQNDGVGTAGGNGGGIIIISAGYIQSGGAQTDLIRANGVGPSIIGGAQADGAGGGGAGGSIYLDVSAMRDEIHLAANGGDGGDQYPTFGCVGPGGGGGAGRIITTGLNLNVVRFEAQPGLPGTILNPDLSCFQSTYGATGGISPSEQYTIIEENNVFNPPAKDTIRMLDSIKHCPGEMITIGVNHGYSEYLWDDGSTRHEKSVDSPGTYILRYSDPCYFYRYDFHVFDTFVNLDLGSDTIICGNDSILLDPKIQADTYRWQDGSNNPTYWVDSPGLYIVEASVNGCAGQDTIVVHYHIPDSLGIGSDTTLCEGMSLELDASHLSSDLIWFDNSTGSSVHVMDSGEYWVIASTGSCLDTFTIQVHFLETDLPALGRDTTVCTDSTFFIHANLSGLSFKWSDGTIGNSLEVASTGIYWAESNNVSCILRDSIHVTILPLPSFTLGPDTLICPDETLDLFGPEHADLYFWNDGSTGSTRSITSSGTYWLNVQQEGCAFADSIHVDFVEQIHIVPDLDTLLLCREDTVELQTNVVEQVVSWNETNQSPSIQVSEGGLNSLHAVINGCSMQDSILVQIIEKPTVDLGRDTIDCLDAPLELHVHCADCEILWHDGSTGPTQIVSEQGLYFVNVMNACFVLRDSLRVLYPHCECSVFVPNSFSPNGDGINDLFFFETICPLSNFKLEIYDRWGNRLYTAVEKEQWTGKIDDQPLASDVYVYSLRLEFEDGKRQHLVGDIFLFY